jgi:hypothetical protein
MRGTSLRITAAYCATRQVVAIVERIAVLRPAPGEATPGGSRCADIPAPRNGVQRPLLIRLTIVSQSSSSSAFAARQPQRGIAAIVLRRPHGVQQVPNY